MTKRKLMTILKVTFFTATLAMVIYVILFFASLLGLFVISMVFSFKLEPSSGSWSDQLAYFILLGLFPILSIFLAHKLTIQKVLIGRKWQTVVGLIAFLLIIIFLKVPFLQTLYRDTVNTVRQAGLRAANQVLTLPIPTDYMSCKSTLLQDRRVDDLVCEWFALTDDQIVTCKQYLPSRFANEPVCSLQFFNPDFIFPQTFNECNNKILNLRKEIGAVYDPTVCEVNIFRAFDTQGNEKILQNLFTECLAQPNATQPSPFQCQIRFVAK